MGTSREFFWAHNRVLLFSEKLARRGIGEILDLVARERQFRPVMTPAVVEGNLRRLMEAQFPLEESGARGLDRLIVTTQFDLAVFPLMLFYELYSTLGQPGVEMIIGKIEVLEEGAAGQGSGGAGGGSETGQAPRRRSAGRPCSAAIAWSAGPTLTRSEAGIMPPAGESGLISPYHARITRGGIFRSRFSRSRVACARQPAGKT